MSWAVVSVLQALVLFLLPSFVSSVTARRLWSCRLVRAGDAGPLVNHGPRVDFSIPEEPSRDEGPITAATVDTTPAWSAHDYAGGPRLFHLYSPHVAVRHPVIHSPRFRS